MNETPVYLRIRVQIQIADTRLRKNPRSTPDRGDQMPKKIEIGIDEFTLVAQGNRSKISVL